jgi:hypothetical protein
LTDSARRQLVIWTSITVVAAAVFVACGGGSDAPSSTSRPKPVEDVVMQNEDFPNINTMTKVDSYFVTNLLGHEKESIAVARSPDGGKFPVGTLLQLVPQEAMVKRRAGWNARTNDWEFFFLETTPQGTKIVNRGADQVVNRFNGNCASCHLAADPKWDLVCKDTHGCEPLPVGDDLIAAIQAADPRPR